MSMDWLGLPPGFRFYPNDKELLNFYLKPKVFGKELPCEIIADKQIYGPNSNPWDVLDDLSTSWMIRDDLKTVYVFTRLTKIAAGSNSRGGGGGRKENYVKKAGCGTWHGETSREPIMEDDRVIGFRRLLVFQINDVDFCLTNEVDLNKIGHWLMHEYVLCGYEDYALCRITVDMSKMAKVKKLCPSKTCKKTTAKVSRSINSKANEIKATNQAVEDKNKQVVLNESLYQESLASPSDQGIVDYLTSSIVEENDCQGFVVRGQALTPVEADQLLMNDTAKVSKTFSSTTCEASKGTATNRGAKDNDEQVVLNESFYQASLASTTCVFPNYDQTIVDKVVPLHGDVGSFGVEEKQGQGFPVSVQALTLEQVDQLLMNDTEDFDNLGIDELSNFGGGYMNFTSFDFESVLDDRSWSELVDKVSNSNNVQTMQNMSCSTALGKRKAFEAQEVCSSKKLCRLLHLF